MTQLRYVFRRWVRQHRIRVLIARHGQFCTYCCCSLVREADHPRQLTVDHWVARSRGGSDRYDNIVLACAVCNRRKGDRPAVEYITSDSLLLRQRTIQAERDARPVGG